MKRYRVYSSIFLVVLTLTLMGCSSSKTVIKKTLEPLSESTVASEKPMLDEQMALAKKKIEKEMRIFDVQVHHDALYGTISNIDKGLTDVEIKMAISEIVRDYMDAYFYEKIGEILSETNGNYMNSDVETLFKSTSRASLYALIELYEWSFYKKNR